MRLLEQAAIGLGIISVGTGIITYGMGENTLISDAINAINKSFNDLATFLGDVYDKALLSVSDALEKAYDFIFGDENAEIVDYADFLSKLHETELYFKQYLDDMNASTDVLDNINFSNFQIDVFSNPENNEKFKNMLNLDEQELRQAYGELLFTKECRHII